MSNAPIRIAMYDESIGDADRLISRWTIESDNYRSRDLRNLKISKRFLIGRALARSLLGLVEITEDPLGKPYIATPDSRPAPRISISHSGTLIAAAATQLGPVGIDIERHRPMRRFDAMAEFCFGPEERACAAVSAAAFYRIWGLREAMAKAMGTGLMAVADQADRVPPTPETGYWRQTSGGEDWMMGYQLIRPGYGLAIAVQSAAGINWTDTAVEIGFPAETGQPGLRATTQTSGA